MGKTIQPAAGRRASRIAIASLLVLAIAGCSSSDDDDDGGDPNPPTTPDISIQDAALTEGNSGTSALTFGISLSAAASENVTVDVATSDGSAAAGSDYVALTETVTIAAGATSASVDVTVNGDMLFERDENFSVVLAAPVNAAIGTGTATGTISNDDTAPTVSIANASVTEGDSGNAALSFQVALSAQSGVAASVDYASSDNTATAGSDYEAASGTVTFAPGTVSQSVTVNAIGDTDDESNESFTVTLSAAADATIADGDATGTIVDDDGDGGGGVFGLDARPSNVTCTAPPRPTADASVSVVDAFPNLPNISQPTKMLLEPVADPRWFVLQKSGQIVTFDPDNATSVSTFLTRSVNSASEGGMLGMAFHPDYPATPEVFISYTVNHSGPSMRSIIQKVELDDVQNPTAGGSTTRTILEVDQDFNNHNGGDIAFGPDGYLYIGFGDGGDGGDPNDRAQDTTNLLGAMLRIDVLAASVSYPDNPYEIPPTNPFAGNPECPANHSSTSDCPEIYAWGLRNPWRWTFDEQTGVLWLADVGQGSYEEVDTIELGGNYGWRCREGAHNFNTNGCTSGYIDPVTEYDRTLGRSITGGQVYRGSDIPELVGRYVFADYATGRIWALQADGQGGYDNDQLIDTNFGPTSFGTGPDGELYFTDINNSRLRRLAPAGGGGSDTIPDALVDTGCTDPSDVTQVYDGLVPYDLNAPFWSDGAAKDRYIGLPDGTTITRDDDGDWEFPAGTVIVKNFRLGGDLVETRHLMRHPDGSWAGYTYEWNTQQTAATRVRGGKTVDIGGQDWIYPSEGQCMECHTSAAGFSLGPETAQLNRAFTYPSTSRTANQLETLDHVMMFASPLPGPADSLPAMASPDDTSAPLSERARAYLHTNCAQCHRPGGQTPSTMDLRYTTSLADTNACDAVPLEGDLGIANARLVAPGDAARSLLIERASRRDSHGMPPVGSGAIDEDGVDLLTSWIDGLAGCN